MLTTKNFSDIVTFSRASSGWSFGSGGVLVQTPHGAPRLDFDPITLAAQGLLSEGPSANICKYGTKLSSWAMTAGVTVDEDVALAPNGSLEADRVTYDGSNTATYRIVGNSGVVSTSGIPYTASIWLRADTPTAIRIYGNGSGAAGSYVTCNVTSQWQRFWTSGVGNGTSSLQVILYSATNNEPFSVYAWCGQIEQGAFPSSSIPTSGDAQVARAADIASITDLSKIAFNPSEGAIFVDFMVPRLAAGAGADPGQGVVGLVGSYPNFLFGVGVGSTGRINLYRTINGVTLGARHFELPHGWKRGAIGYRVERGQRCDVPEWRSGRDWYGYQFGRNDRIADRALRGQPVLSERLRSSRFCRARAAR